MEERPPPSPLSPNLSSSPPPSSQHYAYHSHSPNTYVVQVPKDQIYRVPHPEHAGIPVRRRKHGSLSPSCCRRHHFFLFLLVFLFVLVCVALFLALRPSLPQFSVTHVGIYNRAYSPSRSPRYEFAVRARNANLLMSIAYSKGGNVSLIHLRTQKTIAASQIPGFDQVPTESTPIRITFEGRDSLLLDELQKEGASAMLLLSSYLPLKMKIGELSTPDMDFYVACEIRVTRTTSSEAMQIDSQTCKSSMNENI